MEPAVAIKESHAAWVLQLRSPPARALYHTARPSQYSLRNKIWPWHKITLFACQTAPATCPWSHATSLFGSPTAQWSTGNIRATRFWAGLRGCCHVLWRAWVSLQWAMLCRGWYICASPMHHSNWALAGCGTELRETGIQEVGLPGTPSKAAQCHSALQAGACCYPLWLAVHHCPFLPTPTENGDGWRACQTEERKNC